MVAWTKHVADGASIENSDVVFAGYGVEAPEFNWDDFKGVDVKGKTIIVLVNDPAVPDPADPAKLDPKTFGGKAMTYYGRWTYKFEEGARKGAAGDPHRARRRARPAIRSRSCRATCARSSTWSRRTRTWAARQHRGLDHARRGEEDSGAGRPGLRRAEEAGARRASSSRCRSG